MPAYACSIQPRRHERQDDGLHELRQARWLGALLRQLRMPTAGKCTNCGNDLAPGTRFCGNCGTKVA